MQGVLDAFDKSNGVTSYEPQISFSTKKRIKIHLRNSVGPIRLNELASLNILCKVEVTVKEVISKLSLNE